MKCFFCTRNISAGKDYQRRVEWRRRPGFEAQVFGEVQGADGKLSEATGPLWKVSHNKCYYADKKRRELQSAREADPAAHQRETDYREQEVVDVEDLNP